MFRELVLPDDPCLIFSDQAGGVCIAQQRRVPRHCRATLEEHYAATTVKDAAFDWKRRDQTLGQRIAH